MHLRQSSRLLSCLFLRHGKSITSQSIYLYGPLVAQIVRGAIIALDAKEESESFPATNNRNSRCSIEDSG